LLEGDRQAQLLEARAGLLFVRETHRATSAPQQLKCGPKSSALSQTMFGFDVAACVERLAQASRHALTNLTSPHFMRESIMEALVIDTLLFLTPSFFNAPQGTLARAANTASHQTPFLRPLTMTEPLFERPHFPDQKVN
jgi:hypothetical protein